MKNYIFLVALLLILSCKKDTLEPEILNNNNYFPPINNSNWQTTSIIEVQWNENNLQDLLNYLDSKNTKGFIVLKDVKIVIEEYFNGHSQNAKGNCYSAAKTLT